jgi:4-hydroxy-tetrahydrodipicolinate synthase
MGSVMIRLTEEASGVFVISATPFAEDGSLDLESTERLVDFYLEHGVAGITVLGMMGEAPKLAPSEAGAFLERVLARVAGRVPVVVGVSNAELDALARLAGVAMDAGAAGVMVAPRAGLEGDEAILAYMTEVCGLLGPEVPVVYQDFPLATRAPITAEGFTRLVEAEPGVVMLKHEDWPGLEKLSAVRAEAERRDARRVAILTGNGGLYLPQELSRGADGAMTGFAYPEMLVEVVARHRAGEMDAAEDLFDLYLPLVRHEQQPGFGLAVRKEILRRRGAIASGHVRQPGPVLDAAGQAELDRLMARLERRLASR